MAESSPSQSSPPPAWVIVIAAALGISLAALCGFGGVLAAVAGGLAQPVFALALRGVQRGADGSASWGRDALALAVLWGLGLSVAAVLAAWPLSAMLRDAGLG